MKIRYVLFLLLGIITTFFISLSIGFSQVTMTQGQYKPDDNPEFIRVVLNANNTEARGIISQDTDWTLDKSPYVLTENVQIEEGVTLTIEPGVVVEGNGKEIQTFGTLEAVGTESNLIRFNNVHLSPGSSIFGDYFFINIQYAEIFSGSVYKPGSTGYGCINLRDSIIRDCERFLYLWYPKENCYIERNIFINSGGISVGTSNDIKVYIRNNIFFDQHTDYAIENWASYNESETIVEYNSFLNTDRVAVRLPPRYPGVKLTAKNNFWNTTDPEIIESMIYDRHDDLNVAGYIEYVPFLEKSHDDTPVVELLITTNVLPPNSGSVNGYGSFHIGESVTLVASPKDGYRFFNWTENEEVVSTSISLTFTAWTNRTLVANFKEISPDSTAPRYIYMENTVGELVRADYQKAEDDLFKPDPDTRLINAIRSELRRAFVHRGAIYIESENGRFIDYAKASSDGLTYSEALDNPDYWTDPQVADRDLFVD